MKMPFRAAQRHLSMSGRVLSRHAKLPVDKGLRDIFFRLVRVSSDGGVDNALIVQEPESTPFLFIAFNRPGLGQVCLAHNKAGQA